MTDSEGRELVTWSNISMGKEKRGGFVSDMTVLLMGLEVWRESAAAALSTHWGRRKVGRRAMFAMGT